MTVPTRHRTAGPEDARDGQTAGAPLDRAAVEAFSKSLGEPDWARELRLAAWGRYQALPTPTMLDEGWRRIDLGDLDLEALARLPALGDRPARPQAGFKSVSGTSEEHAGQLVLVDGQVASRELSPGLAERGLLLLSLGEAIHLHPDLVRAHFFNTVRPDRNRFTALNGALWNDGAFIYIPRGLALAQPLQVIHWLSGRSGPALPHTIVIADEAAEAVIVEDLNAPADGPEQLSSGVVEVYTRQAARVRYVNVQELNGRAWHFATIRGRQERDSRLDWLLAATGGRTSRVELESQLRGQGAEAKLLGVVFGEGTQTFEHHTYQDHLGSDTRSELEFKVVLRDRARSNYTGMIRIDPLARRTHSNLENRNLLLSRHARADSDPKLEILNSDVVRCGHGATVGPVDEEALFYMMTRGLPRDEAERLIVVGFFEPLLAGVPLESVRERLWSTIERKLTA